MNETDGPSVADLRARGFFLLPLPPRSKEPPPKGWKDRTEPYDIPDGGNVAVAVGERSGGLAVLITNDDRSTAWASERFGPSSVRSKRGGHWWFRALPGTANETNKETAVGQIELHAAHGKYALVPPSGHPSGIAYIWGGGPTSDLPALPDLRDLWHPGGTHHAELLRISAAKAHDGQDAETIYAELVTWRNTHLPDPHGHPEQELRQLAESAFEKFHRAGAGGAGGGDRKRRSSVDLLIEIGTTEAHLFHDSSKETYASVTVGSHEENYRLRSTSFRRWLNERFFKEEGTAPSSEALKRALEALDAKAEFDGPSEEVFLRVAEHEGDLWIDMGTADWKAIRVTTSGWSVEDKPPVHFVRGRCCEPFPTPTRGGSLRALLPYLNAGSVEDPHFVLAVAWIVMTFHPRGPYPFLVLNGEQGTGKSTSSRFLRALTDPSSLPLRSACKEERDLAVAAQGNRVVAFDNLSSMPDWLSDALCRLSTGGGFGTRQLYTDDEEVIFGGTRPVLINGIPMVGDAADFRDRALPAAWPLLASKQKERDLKRGFATDSPSLFGAILDALVMALAHANDPAPGTDFRMADFVAWVKGAEAALPWSPGTFERVYSEIQQGTVEEAVADNPVAQAIRKLATEQREWEGSASNLYATLAQYSPSPIDSMRPPSWWPKSPKALGHSLKRLAPDLRRVGLRVEKTERRTWSIRLNPPPPREWALTNDRNDQTTESRRETGGRLVGRLPFEGPVGTTDPSQAVGCPPAPVVSSTSRAPQTTTAVDVVSVVSVVSSRPHAASQLSGPVPEESPLGPTLADRALANAKREGSLAPDPTHTPYYYPSGDWGLGKTPKEEVSIEGVKGAVIRGGEVFYDPPPPEEIGGDPSVLYPGGVLVKRWAEPPGNVLYRPAPGVFVRHESSWEDAEEGATVIYSDGTVVRRTTGEIIGRFRAGGSS